MKSTEDCFWIIEDAFTNAIIEAESPDWLILLGEEPEGKIYKIELEKETK